MSPGNQAMPKLQIGMWIMLMSLGPNLNQMEVLQLQDMLLNIRSVDICCKMCVVSCFGMEFLQLTYINLSGEIQR